MFKLLILPRKKKTKKNDSLPYLLSSCRNDLDRLFVDFFFDKDETISYPPEIPAGLANKKSTTSPDALVLLEEHMVFKGVKTPPFIVKMLNIN